MAEIDPSAEASAAAEAAAKAAADAAADKAPVYDDKQQAHFNKTINEAYAKAFEKASGLLSPQIKALEDKIAALTPKPDAKAIADKAAADKAAADAAASGDKSHDEVARLNARLVEIQGIAEENKRKADEAMAQVKTASATSKDARVKEEFIRAADKVDFFDRMDVFNLLKNDFQVDDSSGEVVVIHPGTKLPRQNGSLKNMTIEEFISDFAKTKPHMVRSGNDGGGTGASGSKTVPEKKDEVVDYKAMPRDKFLDLTQKVIAQGYDRR